MVALEQVDYARLTSVKTMRVFSDPIIVDAAAKTSSRYSPEDKIIDAIYQARLLQNMEIDVDEPVKRATWPEVALLLSTVSLTRPMKGDGADMYRWAFYKFQTEHCGATREEVEQITGPLSPLDEHVRQELESLRKQMKVDRDKKFLAERYKDDWDVPKAFWTEWHSGGAFNYDEVDYEPAGFDGAEF